MVNAISTLVGEELENGVKFLGTIVAVKNGSIYHIPYTARRVVKFDPADKSMTHIGPDFGGGEKWCDGTITDSGVIYCVPWDTDRCGILKIDTNTDTATELDDNFPERGIDMWRSCAAAIDGCIYFMPCDARRIMKLDSNNNDAMSSVGDDLGDDGWKCSGTVVGVNGCVYGLPQYSRRIVRYDPINNVTSFVGEEADKYFGCNEQSALGRDGCIYAITRDGRVLKTDTANNSRYFVGNSIESDYCGSDWGDAVLGIDGCVYWPPCEARRIIKYDPYANKTSLVGDDFGNKEYKWKGGCLASDGIIYYFPTNGTRILSIDPWKEYTSSLENKMLQHPEQLGCIFHPSDDMPTDTNFDRAVTKFGHEKVLKELEGCMPPADEVCVISNLYPFMIAASYKESDISVIYQLLRQVPSFVHCIEIKHIDHSMLMVKKRKCNSH